MLHARTDIHTPFHIDMQWWSKQGRNFDRFLAEILGDPKIDRSADAEALDYIDPGTAEVRQLNPLWVRVLLDQAHAPDYITPATPLTNAVLRLLIQNLNQPMSAVDMQRRINRGTPQTLLRVLQAARHQYGIAAAHDPPDAGAPS